jgi:hypothetical protein
MIIFCFHRLNEFRIFLTLSLYTSFDILPYILAVGIFKV